MIEQRDYTLKDMQLAVAKRESELYRQFIEDLKALNKDLVSKLTPALYPTDAQGYWKWPNQVTTFPGGKIYGTTTVCDTTSTGPLTFSNSDKEQYDNLVVNLKDLSMSHEAEGIYQKFVDQSCRASAESCSDCD